MGENTELKPLSRHLRTPSLLSNAVAPMTVVLTGMLYVAGYSRNWWTMYRFGLAGTAFPESIQSTLANGYIALLYPLVFVLFSIGAFWAGFRFGGYVGSKTKRQSPSARIYFIVTKFISVSRSLGLGLAFMTLLLGALGAGILNAKLNVDSTIRRVKQGCKTCFVYRLKDREALGLPVAQDSQRLAVYTRDGLYLIDLEDLVTVRPAFDN